MATIVLDCPRCRASRMTFDILGDVLVNKYYDWQSVFEVCAVCRQCHRPSLVRIELKHSNMRQVFENQGSVFASKADITGLFNFVGNVDLADNASNPSPDDLPQEIDAAFKEGARCLAVNCPNAASAMFRLCLDLATSALLPPQESALTPSRHERRNLAPRLSWLFENNLLPSELRELSDAVKGNGDDGAHGGVLTNADAEDIYDFAFTLLDRLYTEPARLVAANKRRANRRLPQQA